MNIIKRHPKSVVFLITYYLWWAFMAWHVNRVINNNIRCDFSPLLFFQTIPLSIIVSLLFLYKQIKSKSGYDFMIFIALLALPYLTMAVYFDPFHIFKQKNINPASFTLKKTIVEDSLKASSHHSILYKKANHKLGYWIHKNFSIQ